MQSTIVDLGADTRNLFERVFPAALRHRAARRACSGGQATTVVDGHTKLAQHSLEDRLLLQ
jgi:hypothetical protein